MFSSLTKIGLAHKLSIMTRNPIRLVGKHESAQLISEVATDLRFPFFLCLSRNFVLKVLPKGQMGTKTHLQQEFIGKSIRGDLVVLLSPYILMTA